MERKEIMVNTSRDNASELFRYSGRQADESILVIPNGYGSLRYSHTLCRVLANKRRDVFTVNVRGQGQCNGTLSIPGAAADLTRIVLSSKTRMANGPLSIIAHCSAMLYLLEIPPAERFWRGIRSVILYSYLANPTAHLDRFFRRARRYGVQVSTNLGDTDKYSPASYAAIPVPYAVVHPRGATHRLRANDRDLTLLRRLGNPSQILRPRVGYEIIDEDQEPLVKMVADEYFEPLLQTGLTPRA